jgi:hypothetical protein
MSRPDYRRILYPEDAGDQAYSDPYNPEYFLEEIERGEDCLENLGRTFKNLKFVDTIGYYYLGLEVGANSDGHSDLEFFTDLETAGCRRSLFEIFPEMEVKYYIF